MIRKATKFPRGTMRVGKVRSSTGIYGRLVGGTPPSNAVRDRGRRK